MEPRCTTSVRKAATKQMHPDAQCCSDAGDGRSGIFLLVKVLQSPMLARGLCSPAICGQSHLCLAQDSILVPAAQLSKRDVFARCGADEVSRRIRRHGILSHKTSGTKGLDTSARCVKRSMVN